MSIPEVLLPTALREVVATDGFATEQAISELPYRCLRCKKMNLLSSLQSEVTSTCPPNVFYDENGTFHSHDSDYQYISYLCSNGHYFRVKMLKGCHACKKNNEYLLEE
jgi:hypothetical protein